MFDAAEYSDWLAGARLTHEYEHYALQLRVLSTSSPPGATWALKSPSHLGHLDSLLHVLPTSTVVLCHRHPRQAVASYASLVETLRRAYSDDVMPADVGHQAMGRAAAAMQRALDVRRAAGDSGFVDVSYADLLRDPVRAVRAVYRHQGRVLDAGVEGRMRAWVLANPQHKHGAHHYDLERFGLSGDAIDGAFRFYLERFGALVAG